MDRNTGRALGLTLLALLIGIGIAVVAYNAGANHAALGGGRAWAPPANAQVVYVRPWGFGFGFFPFFLILLFFFFIRGLFWRGYRYRHGYYGQRCGEHQQPPDDSKTATV